LLVCQVRLGCIQFGLCCLDLLGLREIPGWLGEAAAGAAPIVGARLLIGGKRCVQGRLVLGLRGVQAGLGALLGAARCIKIGCCCFALRLQQAVVQAQQLVTASPSFTLTWATRPLSWGETFTWVASMTPEAWMALDWLAPNALQPAIDRASRVPRMRWNGFLNAFIVFSCISFVIHAGDKHIL
jgi:hypothetical protein